MSVVRDSLEDHPRNPKKTGTRNLYASKVAPSKLHLLVCKPHELYSYIIPIGSMYGIYILTFGGILMVNVTIYSIHGSYGI